MRQPAAGVATRGRRAHAIPGRRLLRGLLTQGEASFGTVHGAFVLCWWDGRTRCLRLIRDRFGIEPFFYAQRGEAFEFASRIRDLPSVKQTGFKPSLPGIVEFLTFCFLPDNATLDEGVVRAGGWRGQIHAGACSAPDFALVSPVVRATAADGRARDRHALSYAARAIGATSTR